MLNIRLRRVKQPIQLHGPVEKALSENILDDNMLRKP
jgi:hypothetical protein